MSRVIMSLGFAVAIVAYIIGIWGLVASGDALGFAVTAMMGTLLALVMTFAHGSRVGDQE